jgi:CBS domain-containing protein
MEIQDTVASILETKETRGIWSIGPNDMVLDAIQLMSEHNIGALLVLDGEILAGIVSERDYMKKVVLQGKASKETAVKHIMTTPVYCIPPTTKVTEALQLMSKNDIRHLPVTENEKVTGMISIGDLVRRTIASQEDLINQLESYLSAAYLG